MKKITLINKKVLNYFISFFCLRLCKIDINSNTDAFVILFTKRQSVLTCDDVVNEIANAVKTSVKNSRFSEYIKREENFIADGERRGITWQKQLKRKVFGEKMDKLMKEKCMNREEARQYLLRKLYGSETENKEAKIFAHKINNFKKS